ncbi:hypothetical protein UQ19_27740 [Escherichia coli]|nr:hypothetical protein UQ19_27740 [Escherichia coli]
MPLQSLEADPRVMLGRYEMGLLTFRLDSVTKTYADGWNPGRCAMLQAGNYRENKNSSNKKFRQISET